MIATTELVSRRERFDRVGSTNDVVRGWLAAGEPEVCLALADEQTAGRGRDGRTWTAPRDAALLLSVGFRPTWLDPDAVWRLPATVSLAMAEAAERVAGLPAGSIRLKWPNDLVIDLPPRTGLPSRDLDAGGVRTGMDVRKLGGVLGETAGLGSAAPTAIVGIGVNVDWPRDTFPPELATSMTSLRDASGAPVDRERLLDAFLARLETAVDGLRAGRFATTEWQARQVTTDRLVDVIGPGGARRTVRATGVDARTGALLVDDDGVDQAVFVGDIVHIRLAGV